jgi:hypothetical protein
VNFSLVIYADKYWSVLFVKETDVVKLEMAAWLCELQEEWGIDSSGHKTGSGQG